MLDEFARSVERESQAPTGSAPRQAEVKLLQEFEKTRVYFSLCAGRIKRELARRGNSCLPPALETTEAAN
jgi:hypothetical protein